MGRQILAANVVPRPTSKNLQESGPLQAEWPAVGGQEAVIRLDGGRARRCRCVCQALPALRLLSGLTGLARDQRLCRATALKLADVCNPGLHEVAANPRRGKHAA